jgi:DNA-binding NarL/FixJ family response regulator
MRRMALSVLLIDDDPDFRASARRVLHYGGAEVVGEVTTVADAAPAVDALRPDAILLDVGLPDGNGVQLARTLAGREWSPRIVLTSVDVDATSDAAARAAGAAGFVPKHELPGPLMSLLLGEQE